MAFKRALWHSGLTYQRQCENCRTVVKYTDHSLDFRPWFADGFVYCPKCQKPLRHNESFAIDAEDTPIETYYMDPIKMRTEKTSDSASESAEQPSFCTNCGHHFGVADRFCSSCGKKR